MNLSPTISRAVVGLALIAAQSIPILAADENAISEPSVNRHRAASAQAEVAKVELVDELEATKAALVRMMADRDRLARELEVAKAEPSNSEPGRLVIDFVGEHTELDALAADVAAIGDCFEDEAVVAVLLNFEGGAPYSGYHGEIACTPYDDINAGNRPADWRS